MSLAPSLASGPLSQGAPSMPYAYTGALSLGLPTTLTFL
jgi:hypothetical protein